MNWIPDDKEMDIIWKVVNGLTQEDKNRVYYKNNLFEFVGRNHKMIDLIKKILRKTERPILFCGDIPKEVTEEVKLFGDILMEYVYYGHMIMDRIYKNMTMRKSVIPVSDTDSCIVSFDGWYRFIKDQVNNEDYKLTNPAQPIMEPLERDEFGDPLDSNAFNPLVFLDPEYDYDFYTGKLVEKKHNDSPFEDGVSDNIYLKYTIVNILANVMDRVINAYMIKYCMNMHSLEVTEKSVVSFTDSELQLANEFGIIYKIPSKIVYTYNRKCKIIMKNEFTFLRMLISPTAKKNYASLIAVQEGNIIPKDKQLDIKGIEIMKKSSKALKTRNTLKKLLLEDILKASTVDQIKFIKDIMIFEKSIMKSLVDGTREYYKPAKIKSMDSYDNPMRIQGIKAAVAWNAIKPSTVPGINLDNRNSVDIAKVNIDKNTVEKIRDKYPEVYNNILRLIETPDFKGAITAIAIPQDIKVPEWVTDFVDYDTILNDNISAFPFEAVGIQRMDKSQVNYTNIVQL